MLAVIFSLIIGFMTNCHFLEFENNLFNSENRICGGIVEAVKAEDMHSYPTSTQRLLHSPTQCRPTPVQKAAKSKTTYSKLQDSFEGKKCNCNENCKASRWWLSEKSYSPRGQNDWDWTL